MIKHTYESGLVTTLNYKSIEDSIGKDEPIYIYKDEGLIENNITMSIEETKWLIENLKKIVGRLERADKGEIK